jgi:hypothetical protein
MTSKKKCEEWNIVPSTHTININIIKMGVLQGLRCKQAHYEKTSCESIIYKSNYNQINILYNLMLKTYVLYQ